MTKSTILAAAAAAVLIAAPAGASAAIVNIDAHQTGCASSGACGGQHYPGGVYIGDLINPAQLTLGPGTYRITNGYGAAGADPAFDAWNFNGAPESWVWAFMMINDADHVILYDSFSEGGPTYIGGHAAAAAAGTAFSTTFTLAGTTTLDFITEDYGPYDNLGGVALDIRPLTSGAPEPATWALMIGGLGLAATALRRRRAITA